jgi:hypothetical protein
MKNRIITPLIVLLLSGCIGTDIIDDLVEPKIVIDNALISLKIGDTHQFEFKYFNNIGDEEDVLVSWSSSNDAVVSVDNNGFITALEMGEADIMATVDDVSAILPIEVATETVVVDQERTAVLNTTTSYRLTGTATLLKENDKLVLSFSDDFDVDTALPGLYVYLSNSTSNVSNAIEVSKITQFNGAYSLEVTGTDELFDYSYVFFYCKPFSVPVGNGKLNP